MELSDILNVSTDKGKKTTQFPSSVSIVNVF